MYHITDVRNLSGILQRQALLCKRGIDTAGEARVSIAYQDIQDRRATRAVPCGPGGTLHDYVPFYFAPRSPMLYAIHKGLVAGHQWGQRAVVHLVSTVQLIDSAGCPYVFTDGHGVMAYTGYFTRLEDLRCIDWPLMTSRQWANTLEDPDRKRRRQAEFLVYEACFWRPFIGWRCRRSRRRPARWRRR